MGHAGHIDNQRQRRAWRRAAAHRRLDRRAQVRQLYAAGVEHLKALTNILTPWPRITRVVTTFGRQPNSRLFVFGNTCYANGQLFSHGEAGVTVLPHMFGGKEVIIPIPLAKFPKILVVPQDWVRYTFFAQCARKNRAHYRVLVWA